MTRTAVLLFLCMLVAVGVARSQQPVPAVQSLRRIPTEAAQATKPPNLPKFSLDFQGGAPRGLVEAINRASGKTVNAIITQDDADVELPALKMEDVDVRQLFDALGAASQRQSLISSGAGMGSQHPGYGGTQQQVYSSYGFRSNDPMGGDHDSVWYFYSYKPFTEARICRFYQLGPYLEKYKVEDITTAIQTGWKLLGETATPTINYHKDTKLLIAVGGQSRLQLIDSVLQELGKSFITNPPPIMPTKGGKPTQ